MARFTTTKNKEITLKIFVVIFSIIILFDSLAMAEKGRDIIIYNGKVIVKSGKKKGNIIISGGEGHGGQGKFKYNKKYMNYGGYWK